MSIESADASPPLPAGLPLGPDLPGWQLAKLWIEQPVGFWEECAERHGETFTIELGSIGTTVLFSHPEAVRQIFMLSPKLYVVSPYNGYSGTVMGDRAIFRTDGDEHRRKRRLLIPQLTRRPVKEHGETVRSLVSEMIASWPTGQVFSPRPSMHLLSLKFILGIALGTIEGELGREIVQTFAREIYPHFGSWSSWAQFMRHQPRFRGLIAEEVRRRRANPDLGGATLFDAMVQARDESGGFLDIEEIQDHLFTLLVVGVDPAAIALSWALYWIHDNPEVLVRLRQELDEHGPAPDPERIVDLPYLSAVVSETLRMYPIPATPSGRKLVVEASIQGRRYGPGITLLPCTYLVHRREEIYPEPARFRPERFLERRYEPYEYFPFGGGARTCIGAGLAPLEIKLVLAHFILSRCVLAPAHDAPVRPVRHGTLLAPSDGLKFIVTDSGGSSLGNLDL